MIPGALRSLFTLRVAAGQLNLQTSITLLDSKVATNLPKIKGRGIMLSAGSKPLETQFYWFSHEAMTGIPTHASPKGI